jgi:alanine racemase
MRSEHFRGNLVKKLIMSEFLISDLKSQDHSLKKNFELKVIVSHFKWYQSTEQKTVSHFRQLKKFQKFSEIKICKINIFFSNTQFYLKNICICLF